MSKPSRRSRADVAGARRPERPRTMQQGPSSPRRKPEAPAHFYGALDGWRGISACMVALYHFRAPGSIRLETNSHITSSAVIQSALLFTDFFFVLSGFVIMATYGDALRQHGTVRRFLALRIARIWPLHVVTIGFVGITLGVVKLYAERLSGHQVTVFSGPNGVPALISNLLLTQAWHLHPWTTWNRPSWSISAEMTVYALFAVAMRWPARMRVAVAMLVILGAPLAILRVKGDIDVTYDLGVLRTLYGFALGAFTYEAWRSIRPPHWFARGAATAIEVLTLGAMLSFVGTQGGRPGSVLAPLLFALAVYLFSQERGAVSALLRRAPLKQLGLWSYSIYMLHYPLQMAFAQLLVSYPGFPLSHWVVFSPPGSGRLGLLGRTPLEGDLAAMLMLAVLVGLSSLTYRLVEMPPRRWMRARLGHA